MKSIFELIGKEQSLEVPSRELKNAALDLHPAVVGAHHVTCSDETEREAIDAFSDIFVKPLLPTLKLSRQAAFRSANLGARYEWGSVGIAESHFATSESASSYKLMVVKINAHVSRATTVDGVVYGTLDRYNEASECCGALCALMSGARLPSIRDIRAVFQWEGHDRLGALLDPEVLPEPSRRLAAAIVEARLQARLAAVDIRDRRPKTPTVFLVVPCVTVNIPELDGEIVVGVYEIDWRGVEPDARYRGLGDDPAEYEISHERGRARVRDPGCETTRPARDHRALPLETYLARDDVSGSPAGPEGATCEAPGPLEELSRIVARNPVEAALRLFAAGLVPIDEVLHADRLARDPEATALADSLIESARLHLSALPEDQAEESTKTLCEIRAQMRS